MQAAAVDLEAAHKQDPDNAIGAAAHSTAAQLVAAIEVSIGGSDIDTEMSLNMTLSRPCSEDHVRADYCFVVKLLCQLCKFCKMPFSDSAQRKLASPQHTLFVLCTYLSAWKRQPNVARLTLLMRDYCATCRLAGTTKLGLRGRRPGLYFWTPSIAPMLSSRAS